MYKSFQIVYASYMSRYNRIKQISEELDNNPKYVFESLPDAVDTIGYRAADKIIRSKVRRELFKKKLEDEFSD